MSFSPWPWLRTPHTLLDKCFCKFTKLRKAISRREQDLGFTPTPRWWRPHPKVVLTDLDYTDDISLLSDNVDQAQELLNRVELECAKVGLRLNLRVYII